MPQEKILGNQLNITDVATDVAADPSAIASLEGSIDHTNIVNGGGTNSHTQIDAHIAQGSPLPIHNTFTDVVQDTSPQLGGNLDVNGFDIVGVATGSPLPSADVNIVGSVAMHAVAGAIGQATIQLWDDTDTGHTTGNYVALKAPLFAGSPVANITLILPELDGSAGEPLQTNGAGNLSFGTAPVALPGYTVATLPLVVEGGMIYVTDASAASAGVGAQCFGRGVGSPALTEWVDVTTGLAVV